MLAVKLKSWDTAKRQERNLLVRQQFNEFTKLNVSEMHNARIQTTVIINIKTWQVHTYGRYGECENQDNVTIIWHPRRTS
jgi:hypothetical protein